MNMPRMENRKVLITQSDDYMGPAVCDLFTREGADVTTKDGIVPLMTVSQVLQ